MVFQSLIRLNLASSITNLWLYSWLPFHDLSHLIYCSLAPDDTDEVESQRGRWGFGGTVVNKCGYSSLVCI